MRDSKPPVQFGLVSTTGSDQTSSTYDDNPHACASKRDLLLYMGDLLAELETMATKSAMVGLADLLGFAHREVERNLNLHLSDPQCGSSAN